MTYEEAAKQIRENDCDEWCKEHNDCDNCRWGVALKALEIHNSFDELVTCVEKIADNELDRANKTFPMFHSPHEGLAVIFEEAWEASEEMENYNVISEKLKEGVFRNKGNINSHCGTMKSIAIKAAAELIQTAAMCQKMINSKFNKKENNK